MATVKTFLKGGFRHFQCNDEESCLRLSFLIKDAGYGFKMSSNWVKKHTEFKILATEKDPMKDPKVVKGAGSLRINLEEAKGKKASASEVIRNLEMRIARLEKQASMRTAASAKDFVYLWELAEENLNRYNSLDTIELSSGERAIVANMDDMVKFLRQKARVNTGKSAFTGGRRMRNEDVKPRDMLYIPEYNYDESGRDNNVFIVTQSEVRKSPFKRSGYNFY